MRIFLWLAAALAATCLTTTSALGLGEIEAADAADAPTSYGPVQAKETLWSIATKVRPDPSVSMDQVMLALYNANPKAFDGFSGLRSSSILTVPSADSMRSVSRSAAKARIAELSVIPPPPPAPSPAPDPALIPPAPDTPAPSTPAPAPTATVDDPLIPATPPQAETATSPAEPVAPPVPAVVNEPAVTSRGSSSGLYLWLIVGVILIGAVAFFGQRYWKSHEGGEKKIPIPSGELHKAAAVADTSFDDTEATIPPESPMPSPASPMSARNEFEQLQDTTCDTGGQSPLSSTLGLSATPTSETPMAKFDSTSTLSVNTDGFDSNNAQSIEVSSSRTDEPSQTHVPVPPSEHVDFDETSQFASMSINLDAHDPVFEADFHLAYGLYDEAALLLKQTAEKEPGRTDVRVKLAKAYFAASRPAEFQQVAESLKDQLPEAEWQELAIMGQQLCPDAEIFAGAGDIDISFDEPAAPSSASDAFTPPPASAQDVGGLGLKLEELELPELEEPNLEMSKASSSSVADTRSTVAVNTGDDGDVRLDDFELEEGSTAISSGDEAGNKRDLARAYEDIGGNDMVRTLLEEVTEEGNT